MEFITKSEIETEKIAINLAKKLKSKKVLALYGDLGSGKTVFVKGLAKGLGIKTTITSPTFVLIKEYMIRKIQNPKSKVQTKSKIQNPKLIHVDCYRMKNEVDAEAVGLIEYLNQKNNVIAIEWPQKIKSVIPKNTIKVSFENIGKDTRKITIS